MDSNDNVLEKILVARREQSEFLNLSGLGLTELPPEVTDLTSLTGLLLNDNKISALPESIGNLKNLRSLFVSDNQLLHLPHSISNLSSLSDLRLSGNRLSYLPESMSSLAHVRILVLSRNRFSNIPIWLGKLRNLVDLHLDHNEINALPDSIGQLNSLTNIDLRSNNLTDLPDSMIGLTSLFRIVLISNNFLTFPKVLSTITSLRSILLGNNDISTLPDSISNLKDIVCLSMYNNKFNSFPLIATKLTSLNELHMTGNALAEIPDELGELKSLYKLTLGANKLSSIPLSVYDLKNLVQLDLRGNRIEKLPLDITKLKALEYLDLSGNLLPLPPELLTRTDRPREILSYLRQVITASQPLLEAKIVIVGQAGTGKTSVRRRITENTFNSNQPKTDGIDITRWKVKNVCFPHRNEFDDGIAHDVTVNIWDMGGQEIYHATHQFFMTERTVYVLVLSARMDDDQNRLTYWLNTITSLGKDSPIIVVQNQHETNPKRLDEKSLVRKFNSIVDFVEISCLDSTLKGIDALTEALRKQIGSMQHVRDEIPFKSLRVKHYLEATTAAQNFVTIEAYRNICDACDIVDQNDQSTLLSLLNSLGTIIHFDDGRLRHFNVLDPKWVTSAVYQILDDPKLRESGTAILTYEALERLLNSSHIKYSYEQCDYIVELMKKFQLCFNRLGCEREYLIPELLDPNEPNWLGTFPDDPAFIFKYDFLPHYILPRFIVSTHELPLIQTYRWRNGVVIEKDGNRALVRADIEARTIQIWITGNTHTRREFLSILRLKLSEIHGSLGLSTVRELIPIPGYPDAKPVAYSHLCTLELMGDVTFVPDGINEHLNVRALLNAVEDTQKRQTDDHSVRATTKKIAIERQVLLVSTSQYSLSDVGNFDKFDANEMYLNDLANEINASKITPFVGAGMTAGIFPTWSAALDVMFDKLSHQMKALDIRKYSEEHVLGRLEEAAQILFNASNGDGKVFNDQIRLIFGKLKLPNRLEGAISLLPTLTKATVITTNFDAAIEKVYEPSLPFNGHDIILGDYKVDETIRKWDSSDHVLLKLHGDAESGYGRVFTTSQYNRAYGSESKLPELLKAIFGSRRPMLFLGCSLTKDRTLIELQKAGMYQSNAYHYAILSAPESAEKRMIRSTELLGSYGIKPIWYPKGEHDYVAKIMASLVGAAKLAS